MNHINFAIRTVSLLIILVALGQYQNIALARAAEAETRELQIEEVEAYNASVLAQMSAESEDAEDNSLYADGTYEGSGTGFGGEINVSVTIAEGKLTAIDVLNADGEDPAYYDQAVAVIDEMLKAQSSEVDTVSGATFSSTGLIEATADALGKAEE